MGERKGLLSFLNFESIFENLSGYVEKRIGLFKIELKEDLALSAARFLVVLIMGLAFFMIVLFSSLGAAVFLNSVLDSNTLGFFLVAGFYIVLVIVFILAKDALKIEERLQQTFLTIFNSLDSKDGDN